MNWNHALLLLVGLSSCTWLTAEDWKQRLDQDGDGSNLPDDCDDHDDQRSPDLEERCDGLDNDCDDEVDENPVDGVTLYVDADWDGYGLAAYPVLACEGADGWAALTGDCDDGDPAVNPGAQEICGGAIDADCDGAIGECPLSLADAPIWLLGDTAGSEAGRGLCTGADLTGDGVADLAVGGPQDDGAGADAGAAWVVPGPAPAGEAFLAEAGARLDGAVADGQLGRAIEAADLDGDGQDDLLLGAHRVEGRAAQSGVVYLLLGPVDDGSRLTEPDQVFLGEAGYDRAGYGLALPDLNGDGGADVVIGAYTANPDSLDNAGKAYVIDGVVGDRATLDLSGADATVSGDQDNQNVGAFLCAVGDTDGDGLGDLLIGAPNQVVDGVAVGGAWLLPGPIEGDTLVSDFGSLLAGERTGDAAGASVAAARDHDGDGYADLLVGAPTADDDGATGGDAGRLYLLLGPVPSEGASLATAEAAITGQGGGDLGRSASGDGDADGDGAPDVLVGAPEDDAASVSGGAALLYFGPLSGRFTAAEADRYLVGAASGDHAGERVRFAPGLAGGAADDLVVSALGSAEGVGGGAVMVLSPPAIQ